MTMRTGMRAAALVLGASCIAPAALAAPIGYTFSGAVAAFNFNPSGPGSGTYRHEVSAQDTLDEYGAPGQDGIADLLDFDPLSNESDFRPGGTADVAGMACTFTNTSVVDWFPDSGAYPVGQGFSFMLDNSNGTRDYLAPSFSLSMQVTFYDEFGVGRLFDLAPVNFALPGDLLRGTGAALSSYLIAQFTISELADDFDPLSLTANQFLIQIDELGEGFLLNATVPEVFVTPIGVDPDPSVPEPAALGLLGLGLAGVALRRRRRAAR